MRALQELSHRSAPIIALRSITSAFSQRASNCSKLKTRETFKENPAISNKTNMIYEYGLLSYLSIILIIHFSRFIPSILSIFDIFVRTAWNTVYPLDKIHHFSLRQKNNHETTADSIPSRLYFSFNLRDAKCLMLYEDHALK